MQVTSRGAWISIALAVAAALSACTTTVNRAPVEDRGMSLGTQPPVTSAPQPLDANAGKPGYYVVRQGDTLMRIATEANQPWREIVRWNNLDNPDAIEVGQVLRVTPPPGDTVATAQSPKSAGTTPVAIQTTPGTPAATPAPAPTPNTPPPPPSAGADDIAFIWPAKGALLTGFDEASNKGLNIDGKAGDPVLAAADGRVVYAGSGLRGYGQLIILKHNNTFLTAYAHNQKLLVKEDQEVKKGQKIADMGNTDATRVQLHFEIRRSGKPVDPARYLPTR